LINRGNWKLFKEYLRYREEVHQLEKKSVRLEETCLTHVLVWADEKSFKDISNKRPAFPVYMLSARSDGKKGQLSPAYITKVVQTAKRFLEWLSVHKRGHKTITPHFIDTLRSPRMDEEPKKREFVSYQEILDIASSPVKNTKQERLRASLVLLWLTGMRAGAFVTLPLSAVDLENLEINVSPSLGVRVKNRKGRTVHILNDPKLLAVVKEWDKKVRAILPNNGLWFAHLSPITSEIDPDITIDQVGANRYNILYEDIKSWLDEVGLPFRSPHKFRHGNAVYEVKKAKTFDKVKAISQNLGHESVVTTDSIYGVFSGDDVKDRIASLASTDNDGSEIEISEKDYQLFLEFLAFKKQKAQRK